MRLMFETWLEHRDHRLDVVDVWGELLSNNELF